MNRSAIDLSDYVSVGLIAVSFAAAIMFYVNFYSSFFIPVLTFVLYILLVSAPGADLRSGKYREYKRIYNTLKISIVVFLTALYFLLSLNMMGYPVETGVIVFALAGLALINIGSYLDKIKNSSLVGIRNPWTISSEEVWTQTHRASGRLFIVCGLLLIFSILFSDALKASVFILVIVAVIVVPNVYSYILYRRVKHM